MLCARPLGRLRTDLSDATTAAAAIPTTLIAHKLACKPMAAADTPIKTLPSGMTPVELR